MNKIKAGVVGLGTLGFKHAENVCYKIPGVELSAVCTRSLDKLRKAKEIFLVENVYTDFNEMITREKLDAVIIASSTSAHCEHVESAIKKNLHILCEKPITDNSLVAEKLSKIINNSTAKFMSGFMRRFDNSYKYAKELIDKGRIGKPFAIDAYSADPSYMAEKFTAKSSSSGGLFLDLAIHDIDLSRWYFNSEAETVYAYGNCYKFNEFAKANDVDNGFAMIKYRDNSVMTIHAGRTSMHGYHTEMNIHGTEGSLRIGATPEKNLTEIFDENGVTKECYCDYIERFEDAYLNELTYFFDCIKENRSPECNAFDAIMSLKIAEGCRESLQNGRIIYLDN